MFPKRNVAVWETLRFDKEATTPRPSFQHDHPWVVFFGQVGLHRCGVPRGRGWPSGTPCLTEQT
ncbi:MAG: hypothetical protein JNM09_00420 [Blastocatellia bacterium]|nr:hypothetical protein [Blastocatellia bacterium]